MTEAVFPLLGAAFVVLVVLPACALLAKAPLVWLERVPAGGPLQGLSVRYVLLTGSSALPLAWFISAALHQAESGGRSALACLFDHEATALCLEPALFALTLGLLTLGVSRPTLRAFEAPLGGRSQAAAALGARIERLIAARPTLGLLRGRVDVTDQAGFTLGTHGLLLPRVCIGLAFAAGLSDDMLASALGHEAEHVRSRDPLRYLVLRLTLGVNPFGRALLEPHAARWLAAREAHCDREAVIRGAQPLPLADAIVRAARPELHIPVALGASDTGILKLRVGMLLAFAEQAPSRCCHHGHSAFRLSFVLVAVALFLPHQTGTQALDALHTGAEHALAYFWR